ncbi:MAG TPA: alpha/beta hydrolase [Gammaproteobacteria bacterium]|nr:alpha/beta hydrolase [Gammaproteobacteria bacterium]
MGLRRRLPGTPEPDVMLPGSNGIKIAADYWGRECDPLVLLLHGGGQTRHAWKGTGEALAEAGFRAFSLDARGHGDSDWSPDGDYEQDGMVDDLAAVVEYLGDPNPVLVGASMGGGVSLCSIGDGKVNARALILVDMAPRIEAEGAQKILAFMRQNPDGFDSLEQVADAVASYQPHRKRPRQLDGLKKNVRLDENDRLRWHWDPDWIGDRPFVEVDTRWERLETAAKELSRSRLPTLLVRGGLSDVLSQAGADEFLATCPHAEYVNVTDAAHMVAGDRNDIFTSAVAEFLDRLA